MTDSLSGLSVELRKAVITGSDIAEWERKQVDERLEGVEWAEAVVKAMKREYLPAALAAQEMQRIKKVLKDKICLNKTFCGKKDKPELTMSGLVSIKNWHCRNCEKVEEALK